MAKIKWTKPAGKTQADLDQETAELKQREKETAARELLEETDYQVIKAIERFLDDQGILDKELVESRRSARGIL